MLGRKVALKRNKKKVTVQLSRKAELGNKEGIEAKNTLPSLWREGTSTLLQSLPELLLFHQGSSEQDRRRQHKKKRGEKRRKINDRRSKSF